MVWRRGAEGGRRVQAGEGRREHGHVGEVGGTRGSTDTGSGEGRRGTGGREGAPRRRGGRSTEGSTGTRGGVHGHGAPAPRRRTCRLRLMSGSVRASGSSSLRRPRSSPPLQGTRPGGAGAARVGSVTCEAELKGHQSPGALQGHPALLTRVPGWSSALTVFTRGKNARTGAGQPGRPPPLHPPRLFLPHVVKSVICLGAGSSWHAPPPTDWPGWKVPRSPCIMPNPRRTG